MAILLEREVSEGEFEGLARISGFMLFGEDGFEQIDPISYRPNQVMYFASISDDQTYELIESVGAQLDVFALAKQWGVEYHGG
jgi:hypothetical protein